MINGSNVNVAEESCAISAVALCPTILSDFEVREFPAADSFDAGRHLTDRPTVGHAGHDHAGHCAGHGAAGHHRAGGHGSDYHPVTVRSNTRMHRLPRQFPLRVGTCTRSAK